MSEELIVSAVTTIITIIIGWVSGTITEKMRHKNDVEFLFLKEKINAYGLFLGSLNSLSIFTGRFVNDGNILGDDKRCTSLRDQLYSKISDLWILASNPFILNDEDVQRCINGVNQSIAGITTALLCCANNEALGLVDCSSAHLQIMNQIREVEAKIACKYDMRLSICH